LGSTKMVFGRLLDFVNNCWGGALGHERLPL
jgi:hypothetical protein